MTIRPGSLSEPDPRRVALHDALVAIDYWGGRDYTACVVTVDRMMSLIDTYVQRRIEEVLEQRE
jgi:hypothetical protein